MAIDLAWIALSLVLLFAGAEALVRGSASLAVKAGLSRLAVGLTIVAFGTSAPELVVSVKAALSQQGDISLGNVVGSNSFNIGIILGIAAIVCPIPVHRQVLKVDGPIALGVAVLLPLLMWNDFLSRTEGLVLLSGIVVYTWMNLVLSRRELRSGEQDLEAADLPAVSQRWSVDITYIVGGLAILVFGSRLLVENAVSLASELGVSEAVIGLTIVAAGTSMPELATSVVAAFRGQSDIAVGNVIGSNVFNILGILGVASVASPLTATGIADMDYIAMIAFTVLLLPLLYTGRTLHRIEGVVLLALYGGYLYLLWP